MTARREFLAGVNAELPILLGVIPFGLIYGALALQAGIPAAPALAMSSVVFAGSAQFVATQLFSAGAPALVLLLTTLVINLRHVLYSASVGVYLAPLRPRWKWLLAYLLTDEAFAVSIVHYAAGTRDPGTMEPHGQQHWFLLGAGLTLWATWQTSTAVGIFLGAQIPLGWNLDFALPLTFIALARPTITDVAATAAAAVAGAVALLGSALPYRLGLVLATLLGIAAGLLVGRRRLKWPTG